MFKLPLELFHGGVLDVEIALQIADARLQARLDLESALGVEIHTLIEPLLPFGDLLSQLPGFDGERAHLVGLRM